MMNDRNSSSATAAKSSNNNLSSEVLWTTSFIPEDPVNSETLSDDDSSGSNNSTDFPQSLFGWLPATRTTSTNKINSGYNEFNVTSWEEDETYYQDVWGLTETLYNASTTTVVFNNSSQADIAIVGANVTAGSTAGGVGGSAPLLQTPVLAVILAIFCVITIFGNVLVMVAVVRERYLHTVTNYFIVSLATADCLVGTVVMPFSAVHEVMNKFWVFGKDWCDVWHSIDVLASTASILNLCVISLDRYWAIHDPISYPSRMTTRRALLLIALVWMCASLISFPAIAWWRAVTPDYPPPEQFACVFTEDLGYLVFSSTISFYAPLAVMAFTYFKIYRAAAQQSRSLRLGTKQVLACNGESIGLTLRIHRGGGGTRMSSNFRYNVPGQQQDNHNNHHHHNHDNYLQQQHQHHHHNHHAGELVERESLSSSTHDINNRVLGPRRHHPIDLGTMNDNGENMPLNLDVDIHDHGRHQEEHGSVSSGKQFRGFRRPWNRNGSGSGFSTGSAGSGSLHSAPTTTTTPMSPTQNRTLSTTTNPGSMRVVPKHLKHFSISRRLARLAREQKAAKTLGIVMGVFVLCWLPFFIINVLLGFCPEDCFPNSDLAFTVVTWLGWINSGMNPVIYACWSRDFRRAFVKILCSGCPRMTRRSYRTRLRTRTASRTMSTAISSSCSTECVRL